jgi:hypothetical protein
MMMLKNSDPALAVPRRSKEETKNETEIFTEKVIENVKDEHEHLHSGIIERITIPAPNPVTGIGRRGDNSHPFSEFRYLISVHSPKVTVVCGIAVMQAIADPKAKPMPEKNCP